MSFNIRRSFSNFYQATRERVKSINFKQLSFDSLKIILCLIILLIVSRLLDRALPSPRNFTDTLRFNAMERKIDQLIQLLRSLAGSDTTKIVEIDDFSAEVQIAFKNLEHSGKQLVWLHHLKKYSLSFLITVITYYLSLYGIKLSSTAVSAIIEMVKTGRFDHILQLIREGEVDNALKLLMSNPPNVVLPDEFVGLKLGNGIEVSD